ncbi:MAG: RNA-binding S4 domain-containing protein [Oscillospiraceae bacterium]|nr:RNA-binding S4 domain-containing protein [Oscillospiraceae bacterium]
MRLDKYLKVSRLIKRRTVAAEACDNQRVMVNGKAARASYAVKVGDEIEIRFGQRVTCVTVLRVTEHVGKDEASAMYREVVVEPLPEDGAEK